jgi:quercetin 2,3-dioxygenase
MKRARSAPNWNDRSAHRAAQAHDAPRLGADLRDHLLGGFRLDEHRDAASKVLAADLGDREAPRGALDQAHAEPLLEQRDPAAELRLRHADRPARGREAAVLDHLREVVEVVQVLHRPNGRTQRRV